MSSHVSTLITGDVGFLDFGTLLEYQPLGVTALLTLTEAKTYLACGYVARKAKLRH